MKKVFFCLLLAIFFASFSSAVFAQTETALPVESLVVPKSLGKVEDRFVGTSRHWIVQIQDIHAHLTAQENIAAIVRHLNTNYGIDTFALEGGWDATRLPESWGLPNSREKQMLARSLLEEEYVTGPFYAALFSPTPLHLVGIEDAELYEANRQAYLQYLRQAPHFHEQIQAEESRLLRKKNTLYNPALRNFDIRLMEFLEGQEIAEFLPFILQQASALELDISHLHQLLLLQEVLRKEEGLNQDRLRSEAARLTQAYERERLSLEELLVNNMIPEERLQHHPAARAYGELLEVQAQINYRLLFQELDTAISKIKSVLIETPEEKELARHWDVFHTAKHIMTLKATPEQVAKHETDPAPMLAAADQAGLRDALDLGLHFYDLVKKRDLAFFQNLGNNPHLSQEVIGLVAGGFHTDDISAMLRNAGISYVVITPDLGDEAPDYDLYARRLQEELPGLQTLSSLRNLPFTTRFDEGIVEAVLDLTRHRNLRKAVGIVTGHTAARRPAAARPAIEIGDIERLIHQASPDERFEFVKNMFIQGQKGDAAVLLIMAGATAREAIEDPHTAAQLDSFLGNRSNRIVFLEDIPASFLGVRAQVTLRPGFDLEGFVSSPQGRRMIEQTGERLAAAIEGRQFREIQQIIVFPYQVRGEPIRNIFEVVAGLLRSGIDLQRLSPEIRSALLEMIHDILADGAAAQQIYAAA